MSKFVATIILTAAAALLAADAMAASDYMRCRGHIIEGGRRDAPGKYEVLKKCGDPVERAGNTWIYEHGSVRYILRFNQSGGLSAIDTRRI